MKTMIWLGKHITSPGDPLYPVEVEKVYKALRNAEGEVATLQRRLQAIRLIDVNQYRKLKTGLPYLVCAYFQPKVRKKENFLYTERFMIDIDHLSEFGLDLTELKKKLAKDPRVEMVFTSPGGDGLKVLFVLETKISDTGYYAMFYKSFCLKFSEQYNLAGAVDTKTNDVSRCCFVSYDSEAYYNPQTQKIKPVAYLPEDGGLNFEIFNSKIRAKEKELDEEKKKVGIVPPSSSPLSDDILNQIKQKVGVRIKKAVEKTYIQPDELDTIIPEVIQELDVVGIRLDKMRPIEYGRQIRVSAGNYWAEVNIFYGQRGVRIVGTTKTGSNKELCENVVMLLKDHFQ